MNKNLQTKHNTLAGLIPSSDGVISKLAGVSYFMIRKSISQKLRFEIFKRDSFTCKYCGRKAPDVILEVDHINPVVKGGKNDVLNLTTSCYDCNRGKRDKTLSDTTAIDLQRQQLEELQERRNQIDMILKWKLNLQSVNSDSYEQVYEYWTERSGYVLIDEAQKKLRAMVKKYGAIKVTDAIDLSFEKYDAGTGDLQNIEFIWNKVSGILYIRSLPEEEQREKLETSEILRECRRLWPSDYEYLPLLKAINCFLKTGNISEIRMIIDDVNYFKDLITRLYE